MSSFVNKLKVFLGVKADYDYGEQIELLHHPAEEDVIPLRRGKSPRQSEPRSGSKPNLVGLAGGQHIQSSMYILEPRAFEDVKEYVLHLKNRRSLILRLHLVGKGEAQRVVDFMSGTTHALGGDMRKLGDTIFCFTPASVVIEGDLAAGFFDLLRSEEDLK